MEPARDVGSGTPAQRGDRISRVALRVLGSRMARNPRAGQMDHFFTVSLNEALSNKKPIGGNTQRCMCDGFHASRVLRLVPGRIPA